jgi:hypothetical protein
MIEIAELSRAIKFQVGTKTQFCRFLSTIFKSIQGRHGEKREEEEEERKREEKDG